LLGDAPRSVEYWVHRYQLQGLAGLTEGDRSGRPSRLSCQTDGRDRPSASEQAERCRNAGEPMGWQDSVGMDRGRPMGFNLRVRQCPTIVPSTGLSLAQAPATSGQGPIQHGRRSIKKNYSEKTDEGRYRRSLGSGRSALSTARIAVSYVGSLQRTRDPVVYHHHPTRKSVGYFAAVRLCERRQVSCFSFASRAEDSTARASGNSSRCFRAASAVAGRRVVAIQRQCPISPL